MSATTMARAASSVRLLKTGAEGCWDTEGREIPHGGTGQDGELKRGVDPPTPRFEARANGTVHDRLTNLVWMENAGAFRDMTWNDALAKARSHGHGEWRMPNIRELLSLLDYGRSNPILPHGHPFVNVEPAIYWTSTTLAAEGGAKMAWMITLGIGPTVFVIKKSKAHLWLVSGESTSVLRTGQQSCWNADGKKVEELGTGQDGDHRAGVSWPSPRFRDNHDGTITDDATGLVWLKDGNPFGFQTWSHALDCCNRLAAGDAGLADGSEPGDWRLPNIREIESLVDYEQVGPCLPKDHPFANVRPSSYWTSTTVAAGPTEAMFIILGVGPSIFENKEHRFFVWPVRDHKDEDRKNRSATEGLNDRL